MRIYNIALLYARSHPSLQSTSFVTPSVVGAIVLILLHAEAKEQKLFKLTDFLP